MTTSLPTVVLTIAGSMLVFLGLFAAGDMGIVAIGLGAIAVAGVLRLAEVALRGRAGGSVSDES
ncbi:MAG TPA: hypothetical protein VLB67_10495 [Acidimicrobiia bacterium]|nr:hypothetical protein [Acidimicrobiia bacterium]